MIIDISLLRYELKMVYFLVLLQELEGIYCKWRKKICWKMIHLGMYIIYSEVIVTFSHFYSFTTTRCLSHSFKQVNQKDIF